MGKKLYDYDEYYKACYLESKILNQGMSEVWYKEKAREETNAYFYNTTKEVKFSETDVLKENIVKKLMKEGFNESLSKYFAEEMVTNLPQVLYPNIQEWLCDCPISKIEYNGVSIKSIMEQDKKRTKVVHGFLQSAVAMIQYIKNGCDDKSICFNYFRNH